jgi:lysophospholipase L1-like esterase
MSEYVKRTWVDGVTPADAEHFNHMEEGIAANAEAVNRISKEIAEKDKKFVKTINGKTPDANGNVEVKVTDTKEISFSWYRKSLQFNNDGGIAKELTDSIIRLMNIENIGTTDNINITDKPVRISVAVGYKYACALYRRDSTVDNSPIFVLKGGTAAWKYYTSPTTWFADGEYQYLVIMIAKEDNSEITLSETNAIKIETIDIANLQGFPLYSKKWLFIGDSITEHNFRATKNYDEYLKDWLNIIPVNVGMSGTGVTYPFGGNPSWLDKIEDYPTDVDVISVMGALNDRHTTLGEWGDRETNTVYGAVWNYFNNLIEKYPNKPIIYITSTPREYSYGEDGQYTAWVDAFIKTAHNFSIPTLDLYRNSGLRPWNATHNAEYFSCSESPTGDGVHPNDKGQLLIARKIMPFAEQYLAEL